MSDNPTRMTYGLYSFRNDAGPIPHLTINKTYKLSADGTQLGSLYSVTIEGVLTPMPTGSLGYVNLDYMQDKLISGFNTQGLNFLVTCDSNTLISEYPRINSIRLDRSDDNWTMKTPYTIEMEWDGESLSGLYLDSIAENWDIQIANDNALYDWSISGTGDTNSLVVNVTHNISAKGITHYSSSGISTAVQNARAFVVQHLGWDSGMVRQTGVLNYPVMTGYNHARVAQIDEFEGSYSVSETWTSINGGACSPAIEDFTASVRYSLEDGITSVEVGGTIQGLESVTFSPSYNVPLTDTKYHAASGYWACVRPKLLGRAKIASRGTATRDINPLATTFNVAHNPTKGTISYSYQYDDRPCNYVTGALSETIEVSDIYPTDIFASITIPGRAAGPILQDINTVTSHRRSVNINIVMPTSNGCSSITGIFNKPSSEIEALLCALETQLSTQAGQVFKSSDSDSWNPKTGRYNRSVEWTLGYCSGNAPDTSFC